MNKKGQPSGAAAASLVLVILLILVFYILFLPPSEREELLEKEYGEEKVEEKELGHILLSEHVGRLDYISRLEYEHNIQPIYLYSQTEATVLKTINPFYIKNGVGDKQNKIVNFAIEDLENTENILLSFIATKHKGRLIIKLNDIIIFENEIIATNVNPIELPKEYLQRENILEFDVSSVGWKFWTTNEYNLQNVKITGDITDVSTQESRNVFQISATEKNNLEEIYLRFLADCKPKEVGRLDVLVNGYEAFTGVPDCGSLSRKLYINKEYIKSGTNNVVFKTLKGSYLIDQIKIHTKLKEVKPVTYYFELNSTDYENLKESKVKVMLEADLVEIEEGNVSDADFIINNHKVSLNELKNWNVDERRFDYYTDINKEFLKKGSNSLSIKPKTALEITEIKVILEEI